jgi:hypothetical protein
MTITGSDALTVGSGRANIVLPKGTQLTIEDALLYTKSTRTLLSYKDICKNGLHVETHVDGKKNLFASLNLQDMASKFARKYPPLNLDCTTHT